MKILLSTVMFILLCVVTNAQIIKGIITDEKNQPVPFATIYIENLKIGANSNIQGKYELSLKTGKYKVFFRSLGYKQIEKEVAINEGVNIVNAELPAEIYQIKEVVIKQSNEDPAYPIMRMVIAWAPYHLNQVKHYQSEVYLKGTMIVDNIPKLIANRVMVSSNDKQMKIKTGDVYLGESVNEIVFDAPNKYKHKIKSVQSSFPNLGNEVVTPIEFIKSSLYQPSLMDCVSPCAPDAFAYYKFVYEGYFEEGDYTINKIRVEPKRKSQQVFSGYLYIVDQYWSIHSAELLNQQFWGSMKVSQICTPLQNEAWMPVSYNFHITFSMMGLKGQYRYSSSVKYSDISINDGLTGPRIVQKSSSKTDLTDKEGSENKVNNEMESLMAKDKLSNREMRKLIKASKIEQKKVNKDTVKSLEIKPRERYTLDKGAKDRDSMYWSQTRAIPLTAEELKSYQRKDSLKRIAVNDTSKNSSNKSKNKFLGKTLGGFSAHSKDSSLWFRYNGLLNLEGLSFNTVDGWLYKQSFSLNYKIDSMRDIWMSPSIKYAFKRKELMGSILAGLNYDPFRHGSISLNAGVMTEDFNHVGMRTFDNTVASLFFRENYMKLFERKHVSLGNSIDIANGLSLNTSIGFEEMRKLRNHSDYSFFYRNQRDYTSNIPENDFFSTEQPYKSRSFTFDAGLTFTPEYYYRIEKHRKYMVKSRFPTFTINYKTAIEGVFGSTSKYSKITAGIKQRIDLKRGASIDYNLLAGAFFNANQMHFSEFQHFNTQPLLVLTGKFGQSFQLLDFYKYSTNSKFIETHLHYGTQLLLLKYLPWLSNTIWSENLYFNYLSTPLLKNYTEVGYGLGDIALMANLGIFTSFENGKYKSFGVKLSINFGN